MTNRHDQPAGSNPPPPDRTTSIIRGMIESTMDRADSIQMDVKGMAEKAREPLPKTANDVVAIGVTLDVDGDRSLFVLLTAEGLVNRMGSGLTEHPDDTLFVARGAPELFEQLRARITPALTQCLGHGFEATDQKGSPCELTIALACADGREAATTWRYGSQSQGAHPAIRQFVMEALETTEAWFREWNRKIGGPKK